MAVANGTLSYMPPAELRTFQNDLALLPAVYAKKNDTILVSENMHPAFREKHYLFAHKCLNFATPTGATAIAANATPMPWGWSKATIRELATLMPGAIAQAWTPQHKQIRSKALAVQLRNQLYKNNPGLFPYQIKSAVIEAPQKLNEFLTTNKTGVLKSPWDSSGRGVRVISNGTNAPLQNWATAILNKHQHIVAEEKLTILSEYSLQFRVHQNKTKFCSVSEFVTDENGNYLAGITQKTNFGGTNFQANAIIEALISVFNQSPIVNLHQGYFGIDAMLFTNAEGNVHVNPLSEINLRLSMGFIIQNIRNQPQFNNYNYLQIKRFNNKTDMLRFFKSEAYLPLTDFYSAKNYVAFLTPTIV